MRKKSFFLASLFLFTLAVIFSCATQWEFDEATTYFSTEHQRLIDIVTYKTFNLANNHVINSIWVWLLQQVDITTPFFYRLLSVCSYPLYLLYIYKLLRLENRRIKTNLFFLPLLVLPYFFFFGIARGYAMAVAFFTVALFYYRMATVQGSSSLSSRAYIRYLYYFTGAGIISSLSVFSFIYPIIAMHVLHLAVVYLPLLWQKRFSLRVFLPYSISLLVLLFICFYIFKAGKIITQNDPMIIGSNSLFKGGTLSSMITFLSLEHYVTPHYLVLIKIVILITIIPALITLVANRFYHELVIFAITILLLVASHYVAGSLYPLTRSVVYLVLLLYLPFTYYAMNLRGMFIKAHLLVVLAIGLLHLVILFNELRYKSTKDIAAYMSQTNDTLLTNVPNPNVLLYSHLHYNDAVKIICIPDSLTFMKRAQISSYILAYSPLNLDNNPGFELKYKMHLSNFYIRRLNDSNATAH